MNQAAPRLPEDEPDYLKVLLAKAGIDAQAHTLATNLQEVVIGELHHRVKNTLAIVSAITSQSIKSASSLEEAGKTIADRLHALGVAQDLLVRERWTGAGCRTLIESAVKAFQSKGTASIRNRRREHRDFFRPRRFAFDGHSRTLHQCRQVWRAVGP